MLRTVGQVVAPVFLIGTALLLFLHACTPTSVPAETAFCYEWPCGNECPDGNDEGCLEGCICIGEVCQ